MGENKMIQEALTLLLENYYNGSFVQLVCDYIRFTGMTPQEVEKLLEEIRIRYHMLKLIAEAY
jgi:hypothetical protein